MYFYIPSSVFQGARTVPVVRRGVNVGGNVIKFQAPISKLQKTTKHQAPIGSIWDLELDDSLDVGAWNLELFISLHFPISPRVLDCLGMRNKLVVVADLGHLKAYRVEYDEV